MPVIPIRVSDDEMELLKEFAKFENVSVSALLRIPLKTRRPIRYNNCRTSPERTPKDPRTTSLKDVMKEYGL